MRINKLPKNSRPREKLARLGPQALSTKELIMILLNTGTATQSVAVLASKIEKQLKHIAAKELSIKILIKMKGIGLAKASIFIAAQELFERFSAQNTTRLTSPEVVVHHLQEIRNIPREKMIGLYLTARCTLIHKEIISIGSANQAIIEPRDIFAPIREYPAVYVILAHNHPSGDPHPSDEDLIFTQRVVEAGKLLGIEIIDHIIVTENSFCSLKKMQAM